MQIAGRTKERGAQDPRGRRWVWGRRARRWARAGPGACGRRAAERGSVPPSVCTRVRARAPPRSAGRCAADTAWRRAGAHPGRGKPRGGRETFRRGWPRRARIRTRSRGARPAQRPHGGRAEGGPGGGGGGGEGARLPGAGRLPPAPEGDRTQLATSGIRREESARRRRRTRREERGRPESPRRRRSGERGGTWRHRLLLAAADPRASPSLPGPRKSFSSLNYPHASCHLLGKGPHLCLLPLRRRGKLRNQAVLCSPRALS